MNKLIKLFAIAAVLSLASVAAFAQSAPAAPTIAPSASLVKDGKCYETSHLHCRPWQAGRTAQTLPRPHH